MYLHMLETRRGSEDGFHVKQYIKGWTYEVADMLACYFIKNKCAIKATEDQVLDYIDAKQCQGRDAVTEAADRCEQKQAANCNHMETWQIQAKVMDHLLSAFGHPPRPVITNPQTYSDKGEPL